jgi:hypothetical protein
MGKKRSKEERDKDVNGKLKTRRNLPCMGLQQME